MLSEILTERKAVVVLKHHKRKCIMIATYVILQCLVALIGSSSILLCVWSPRGITNDYHKLARIMYLYDPNACRKNRLRTANSITGVMLSNFTGMTNLKSIRYKKPIATVSTRLSSKTRRYMEFSVAFHIIWLVIAITLYIVKWLDPSSIRIFKIIIIAFLSITICMTAFDISMAIVYIAHIQQSLTKGMVLRYSGWSVELKLKSYEEFGGWLPIIASVCWLRGIVILGLNIFCCQTIMKIWKKIKKRELKKRLMSEGNLPLPDPRHTRSLEAEVLYFRAGEKIPQVKQKSQRRSLIL